MELTDTSLIVLLATLALALFALVVAGLPRWGNGVARAVVRGVQVVLLNLLVVALAGAALNDQYLFYSNWGDLFGSRSASVQVHHGGTTPEVVAAPVQGPGLRGVTTPTVLPPLPQPGSRLQRVAPSSTSGRTPRARSSCTSRSATTPGRRARTRSSSGCTASPAGLEPSSGSTSSAPSTR